MCASADLMWPRGTTFNNNNNNNGTNNDVCGVSEWGVVTTDQTHGGVKNLAGNTG